MTASPYVLVSCLQLTFAIRHTCTGQGCASYPTMCYHHPTLHPAPMPQSLLGGQEAHGLGTQESEILGRGKSRMFSIGVAGRLCRTALSTLDPELPSKYIICIQLHASGSVSQRPFTQ